MVLIMIVIKMHIFKAFLDKNAFEETKFNENRVHDFIFERKYIKQLVNKNLIKTLV